MSQHDPDILLPLALAAGADGCMDKSRLKQDILSTIERVTSAIKKDAGPDLSTSKVRLANSPPRSSDRSSFQLP